jgi:3-ketosteroid 9alpha-monooxygenase subunit B
VAERANPDLDTARRAHGFQPLRVAKVVQETPDTRSYVLVPTDGDSHLFDYRPGQFCTFRVTVGDEELLRCYSMSSAPETDAELTVTVKRMPEGRVSGWLHDNVAEGDVVEATRPAGAFCIRDHDRPIVAFAGGSGITPVMSITKSVLASTDRPVRLLYANRDRDAVIFHDQLDELASRHGARLDVQHHLDSEGGYLDGVAVRDFIGQQHEADFYLCGPTPFMDLVERVLADLGIDDDQIFIERFVNDDARPRSEAGASGEDAVVPDEVTIILKGKRHTVAYRPGDTLLDTARRGGLSAPFSCEAGECATCMAFLKEGAATMRVNNALDDDEVEEGWVLTCQARPNSTALTIEYESL